MNWSLHSRRILASLVILAGVVGCGSDGVDQGMPKDPTKADVPLDPKMVDVTGKMGPGAARKAQTDAAKAATASPGGETPAEKK
jgi:hypothetical protein